MISLSTETAILDQVSHNEEIFRQDIAGPSPENITISEEVQQENQDTAPKSRLRLASSEPCILSAFNKDNQEPQESGFTEDEKARLFMLLEQTSRIASSASHHNLFYENWFPFYVSLILNIHHNLLP